MSSAPPEFLRTAGRVLNAGVARTLVLSGNIHDLFPFGDGESEEYQPLMELLMRSWSQPGRIPITYALNDAVKILNPADEEKVRQAWMKLRYGRSQEDLILKGLTAKGPDKVSLEQQVASFDEALKSTRGNPSTALEFLRQLCLASRSQQDGQPLLRENLIVIIEGADMLIPDGQVANLRDDDRHRIAIIQDWFSDAGFMQNGRDAVVLLTESRSLLSQRIAKLPQILEVEVPYPNLQERLGFLNYFRRRLPSDQQLALWGNDEDLVKLTAGLSIYALNQLLVEAVYDRRQLTPKDVLHKVEVHIQDQLGEGVVEFKKPSHRLSDVVGNTRLKQYIETKLMPRLKRSDEAALPGAAVAGSIGAGKTFIFEALASETDMVVLQLKNLRSKWFGETDVIFERLRRVLYALEKVMIFVDEADTQFGNVGPDAHETERRLTGKIQAMMSDTDLLGKVFWLLMTARIHLLSADIRRPGRVGSLIMLVLDPVDEDRQAFIHWTIGPVWSGGPTEDLIRHVSQLTVGYSAASFAALRSDLVAEMKLAGGTSLTAEQIVTVCKDVLTPPIDKERRFQELQALRNCTVRSLLPGGETSDDQREKWAEEIRSLERQGIH